MTGRNLRPPQSPVRAPPFSAAGNSAGTCATSSGALAGDNAGDSSRHVFGGTNGAWISATRSGTGSAEKGTDSAERGKHIAVCRGVLASHFLAQWGVGEGVGRRFRSKVEEGVKTAASRFRGGPIGPRSRLSTRRPRLPARLAAARQTDQRRDRNRQEYSCPRGLLRRLAPHFERLEQGSWAQLRVFVESGQRRYPRGASLVLLTWAA